MPVRKLTPEEMKKAKQSLGQTNHIVGKSPEQDKFRRKTKKTGNYIGTRHEVTEWDSKGNPVSRTINAQDSSMEGKPRIMEIQETYVGGKIDKTTKTGTIGGKPVKPVIRKHEIRKFFRRLRRL
ncbi:MAG: hypothetical protein ABH986_05705 [archaeon]